MPEQVVQELAHPITGSSLTVTRVSSAWKVPAAQAVHTMSAVGQLAAE